MLNNYIEMIKVDMQNETVLLFHQTEIFPFVYLGNIMEFDSNETQTALSDNLGNLLL